MRIRINGQLLLLMLAEKLIKHGARIKQLNTDGVLYTIKKNVDLDSILKQWEDETKLTLETEEYEAFYQFAINDYLAVGKGYKETKNPKLLKYKGLFIPKVSLGKGMQPMVIPKAINAWFTDKVPVEETIMNNKDINDFITYQKVGKKFSVEYKGNLVQHINRYYVSKSGYGGCLYKCTVDDDGRRVDYTNMLKGYDVTLVNNLEDVKEFPKDINYQYYIYQAKKIINQLENKQLSLYDIFDYDIEGA
jgi:hypothetical protein